MESLEIEPEKHGEYKTEDTDEKAVLLNYFRGNYFSEGRRSCSLKRVNYFSLALSLLLVASNVVLIGFLLTKSSPASPLSKKVLVIGTTFDYLPFTGLSESGKGQGIDIDLSTELSMSLKGRAPVFVKTTWSQLVDQIAENKFDLAVGGIDITLERRKSCYFSQGYAKSGKVGLTLCRSIDDVATVDRMRSKMLLVGVNKGGTNEKFADRFMLDTRKFDENGSQMHALLAGEIDVVVTDIEEAAFFSKKHTNYCHSPLYTNSSKAFLLPQDDAFKSYVDAWLSENQNFVEEVFRKYTE